MKIIPYLELMVRREASDLYLTTGAFASIKVMGHLEGISKNKLKPGVIAAFPKNYFLIRNGPFFIVPRK